MLRILSLNLKNYCIFTFFLGISLFVYLCEFERQEMPDLAKVQHLDLPIAITLISQNVVKGCVIDKIFAHWNFAVSHLITPNGERYRFLWSPPLPQWLRLCSRPARLYMTFKKIFAEKKWRWQCQLSLNCTRCPLAHFCGSHAPHLLATYRPFLLILPISIANLAPGILIHYRKKIFLKKASSSF